MERMSAAASVFYAIFRTIISFIDRLLPFLGFMNFIQGDARRLMIKNSKSYRIVGRVSPGQGMTFERKNNDIMLYFLCGDSIENIHLCNDNVVNFFNNTDILYSEKLIKFDGIGIKLSKYPFGGFVMIIYFDFFPSLSMCVFDSVEEFENFRKDILCLCNKNIELD